MKYDIMKYINCMNRTRITKIRAFTIKRSAEFVRYIAQSAIRC